MKIRADLLLVARGLAESRAKARAAIEAGGVTANGRPVTKASDLVEEDADLVAPAAHPWVGRGGLKLVHALDLWPIEIDGLAVLDVGASTGGFTEVCLGQGAAQVYAVDVGRGQLHHRVAADPRVVNLEGTDARHLTSRHVPEAPGLIVADVSFIALAKALPAALGLAAPGTNLVALVKPQFEVGRERVGKGGIVTDPAARAEALEGVKAFLTEYGWTIRGSADSPISGADGNREFLLWASR